MLKWTAPKLYFKGLLFWHQYLSPLRKCRLCTFSSSIPKNKTMNRLKTSIWLWYHACLILRIEISHDKICQNEWRRAKLTASVYERCLLMATWHVPISSFPGASQDLECQHLLDLDDACDYKSAFWDKISHWSNDKKILSYILGS